jgi:hypothetical protein
MVSENEPLSGAESKVKSACIHLPPASSFARSPPGMRKLYGGLPASTGDIMASAGSLYENLRSLECFDWRCSPLCVCTFGPRPAIAVVGNVSSPALKSSLYFYVHRRGNSVTQVCEVHKTRSWKMLLMITVASVSSVRTLELRNANKCER